jgi:HTH-type transcriptional regulator/antitoxin HigA
MTNEYTFQPAWVSAPGDTMADILEERNLSLINFAAQMGHTPEHASELIRGRVMITIETARKLEDVLGASAAFWMIRESQYREDVVRLQVEQRGSTDNGWVSEIPVKDMIKFGWLKPSSQPDDTLAACLHFFGVPHVAAWRETYRSVIENSAFRTSTSFEAKPGAVAAWLRQGEIESESINCQRWDAKRFRKALFDIRSLTRKKDPNLFIPQIVNRCAECGVAVVIVRAPNGCRASGATRFLSPSKALMVLSFRYLSDDHFWFTFFHEAGHILLHGEKALFLEGLNSALTKEEKEANDFAAAVLIPDEFRVQLMKLALDSYEVIKFAKRVGVSPGIVVGQLQHLGRFKPNQLNSLKRRFTWGNN